MSIVWICPKPLKSFSLIVFNMFPAKVKCWSFVRGWRSPGEMVTSLLSNNISCSRFTRSVNEPFGSDVMLLLLRSRYLRFLSPRKCCEVMTWIRFRPSAIKVKLTCELNTVSGNVDMELSFMYNVNNILIPSNAPGSRTWIWSPATYNSRKSRLRNDVELILRTVVVPVRFSFWIT